MGSDEGRTGSLRGLALRGSLWTIGGQAAAQGLRLASNLVLTRLLFPEAFGLMALVQVVIQGLVMFSEVGVRSSIIYHERGDDPAYLDTAWTVQILRGGLIQLGVIALALPMAHFYGAPQLAQLLPVVGLAALIDGFASTARYSLVRRVLPSRQIAFDLCSQALALGVMCVLAYFWRSVWVLVIGNLVGALARTASSHFLIPGYRNGFAWDRAALAQLLRFGRWIYVSAILAFLMSQGDRLVLGKLFTTEEFGVFTIALFLSQAVVLVMEGLSSTVLQPVYSRLQSRPAEEMRGKVLEARRVLLGVALPPLCLLILIAPWLVDRLYDERYVEAGWMLRILAIGAVGQVISISAERVILARGDSFRWAQLQFWRVVLLSVALGVGLYSADRWTLLVAISAARLASYVPLALLLRPLGTWLPRLDTAAFALSGAVIVGGLALVG